MTLSGTIRAGDPLVATTRTSPRTLSTPNGKGDASSIVFRPVVFQCVGILDNLKFNFVADAGWRPPDNSTNTPQRKLHDTKAVAFLTPPPVTSHTNSWRNIIKNLHHVEGTRRTIGCERGYGIVEGAGNDEMAKKIKLRHTIFTPNEGNDRVNGMIFPVQQYNYDAFPTPNASKEPSPQPPNETAEDDDTLQSESVSDHCDPDPTYDCQQFTNDDWRYACSYLTREAFDDVWQKGQHDIHPIPAYGLNGELIHPSKYQQELAQSVVHVSFVADHQTIGKNRDNYYADIVKIQVLYKLTTETPTKRPSDESDRVKALRKKLRK
ncbi:hypothetical protein BXZ70DRAFT_960105 [Cristinia sonorae]|uniref:Uncharacterized protein n=1 Tax=Cristinia sonorae TaxID=1940300 RepID=A0A8K0XKD0_9AGAR|nr:hypothetical protein BXZ70DRAFT_960105 [Cristinia sonorae]